MGQGFKNHYESTKFQAEVWVRELMDRVPTTILPPGDRGRRLAAPARPQKFDGPYYMLRAIAARGAHAAGPSPQFGRSEAPFNVVPVDFVVDAIAAAAVDPAIAGETLHLVDPEPLTAPRAVRAALAASTPGASRAAASPPSWSRRRCASSRCARPSAAPPASRSST